MKYEVVLGNLSSEKTNEHSNKRNKNKRSMPDLVVNLSVLVVCCRQYAFYKS